MSIRAAKGWKYRTSLIRAFCKRAEDSVLVTITTATPTSQPASQPVNQQASNPANNPANVSLLLRVGQRREARHGCFLPSVFFIASSKERYYGNKEGKGRRMKSAFLISLSISFSLHFSSVFPFVTPHSQPTHHRHSTPSRLHFARYLKIARKRSLANAG